MVLGAELTVSAYGAALALADALGAVTDGIVSEPAAAGILAGQRRGRATATLGEIRNRADLIVYWAVDPDQRYPRYRSRYAGAPRALHLADGAHPRAVVSVSVGGDAGPADADLKVVLTPSQELAALAELRAGLLGRHLGGEALPSGVAELAGRLTQAKYVAIVHDGEPTAERRTPERAEALIALTQALNAPTRAALSTLRAGGNRNGAEAVSTVADRLPLCGGFLPRGAPVSAAPASRQSRRPGALGRAGDRRAREPARPAPIESAARPGGRDRPPCERRAVSRQSGHRYRRRRDPRSRHRVPDGRHPAAAAGAASGPALGGGAGA